MATNVRYNYPYQPQPSRTYLPGEPSHGWGERAVWQVIVSVLCVHAVLLANYIHLQHTQKVQHTSQLARYARLVIFILMPTLVLAELIVNTVRTFAIFLLADPNSLTLRRISADSRRYIGGIFGMNVAPPRPFEDAEDVEQAGETRVSSAQPADISDELPRPHLSIIHDPEDLQHNRVKLNGRSAIRIALLLLAIAQSVGTIILWVRRVGVSQWHWPLGFDKRNFLAAISSILCSISGIAIILGRSEWSFKPLINSETRPKEYVVRTFAWELFIASILNETPFLDSYGLIPISWFRSLVNIFSPAGLVFLVCFVLLAWFAIWAFSDHAVRGKIMTINWGFVISLPVVAFLIWILVDVVVYLILDIRQLTGTYNWHWGSWHMDPWTKYIPFC